MRNENVFPEYKQIFWRTVQRYESASENEKPELLGKLEKGIAGAVAKPEWYEIYEGKQDFIRACRIFCRVYGLTHLLKKYGLL